MLQIFVHAVAFMPPPSLGAGRLAVAASRSLPPVAIGGFQMPSMPSFGGGGDDSFKLFPDDVQFVDTDGETVTIRPVVRTQGLERWTSLRTRTLCSSPTIDPLRGQPGMKKVDFYVNGKLRLSKAVLARNGNMLEITGTITKGTPFSIIGFNLEDVVTEGTQPRDPADCDKAMAVVA